MSGEIEMESSLEVWDYSIGRLIRQNIKKSNPNVCYCCPAQKNITQHHMIPKCSGGMDSKDNLVPICEGCHQLLHFCRTRTITKVDDKWWLERLQKVKLLKELEREFRR